MTPTALSAGPPAPLGARVIQPYDYKGVTLLPGPLKSQLDEVRQFYLSISDDDLLKGFRTRAGLYAPGKDLGGWYSTDTFLIFGQIVSGLARLYAATGDPACAAKACRLVSEWGKCIGPDGYFYASPHPNAPHYVYDKMLWGLLDTYLYCGYQPALGHMSRITDWAVTNLDRSRLVNDISTEWYTLSENLYRAYLVTGAPVYRQFAEVWEYHDYWDIYARGDDIFAPRPDGTSNTWYHAYSHVNTLGGAGAAYLVKGDAQYLQTLINAADYLQTEQCFPTGGFGPDEQLVPHAMLVARLGDSHNTFETQCGSWAVFKLAKYLLSFTGDASYGDWIERLVYNGIGASISMTTNGDVQYYSDYCLYGGEKRNFVSGWTCDAGTRPQAVADYADLVYFHDAQDLYVNLFTPSAVTWQSTNGPVTVTQITSMPESDQVRLLVSTPRTTRFAIKLRAPGWLAGPMLAYINGRKVDLPVDDHHWAGITCWWDPGDELRVRLPMNRWTTSMDPSNSTPVATLIGPVLLAFEAPTPEAIQEINPSTWNFQPVKGHPLWFSLISDPNVLARPLSSFAEGDVYFAYWDPKSGTRIPYQIVNFTGAWWDAGIFRDSNEAGDTAECEFSGTGIRWLGYRYEDAGFAEIALDGTVIAKVSQYGPGRGLPFDWSVRGLAPGRHSIRLRVLEEKPAQSQGRYLNVEGFEMLN